MTQAMTQAFRSALRHPWLWWGFGLLWTAIIVVACFTHTQPSVGVSGFDKLLHTAAFAGLAGWFGSVYARRRHLLVAVLLLALGIVIELGQSLTSYRSAELLDLAADAVGIVIGIGLANTRLADAFRYIEARVLPARN